jgi:cytochrome P450
MMRDPKAYKDPESFEPARFLGVAPEQDPSVCVWGFGRRICPGRFLAENSAFSFILLALSTLSISKVVDGTGIEILPKYDTIGTVIM